MNKPNELNQKEWKNYLEWLKEETHRMMESGDFDRLSQEVEEYDWK